MKFLLVLLITLQVLAPIPNEAGQRLVNPDKIKYPPLAFNPPRPAVIPLSNGSTLYLLSDHELPLVNVTVVFKAGSIYDPPGKEGLAELTGQVMRSGGTKSLSGAKIDEILDSLGATIEIKVGKDQTSATLSVLKKDLGLGLELFAKILKEPDFEEQQLELARRLKIAALKRIIDDPDKLAFREFSRLIYRDNPRGRLVSIKSLNNINRDDLFRFQERFLSPERMSISFSGDISRGEAMDLVNRHFGHWQSRENMPVETIPVPERRQKGGIYHLEKDTPQSVIIVGWLAPSKSQAEYFPFSLADFLIGSGGFRSKIFSEIRTNQGLAYSTGSVYRSKGDYGLFFAYSITKTQSTGRVLTLLKRLIDDFRDKPGSVKELDWAKRSINYGFIFSFLSADQINRQYLLADHDRLPKDYFLTYRDKIAQTTWREIKEVARDYLTWEEAVILVVGRSQDFDRPLSDFGPVTKVTANLE